MKAKFFLSRLYLVTLLTLIPSGFAPDYAIGQSSNNQDEKNSISTEKLEPEKQDSPPGAEGVGGTISDRDSDNHPLRDIFDLFRREMQTGGQIYVVIVAGIGATSIYLTRKFQEIGTEKRESGSVINEKRNSIIIVGIGGTGKSTLINKLLEKELADHEIRTNIFNTYENTISYDSCQYNYAIADYSGQNIGTLIKGLLREQRNLDSPMNFSKINSIILVVDLAKAVQPGIEQSQDEVQRSWQERASFHVEQWNETALDTIFGLVALDSLKYFCLFINKVDLLPDVKKQEIITEYQALIDKIAPRCQGLKFDYHIGSAREDINLNKVKDALKKRSVSIS